MDLTDQLKEIVSKMECFIDPGNPDGFYREFVFWVCKTWSTCEYIETEVVDVGYDCSTYPKRTGLLSSDELNTYKDFINSNTGDTVCTFNSGSGMRCEEYSDRMQEIYGEACAKKLKELFTEYQLEIPDKYKSECDDVNEFVFCEIADYKTDSELYDVCEIIATRFGSIGDGSEPYMCNVVDYVDGESICEASIFGNKTLSEFKKLMLA
tara:strand:+ start:12511 stop:13137 length:627 start_codon:yes stop_codon:yes gene_type:complete